MKHVIQRGPGRVNVLKAAVPSIALLLSLSTGFPARAQAAKTQQSEQILQPAGDTVEHDSFGTSAAISGNTMVIGGFNADGNEPGAGAAFIFDKIGGKWVQTARLFAADGQAEPVPLFPGDFRSDSFGSTVAISEDGNTVIAGAPQHRHPGLLRTAAQFMSFNARMVSGASKPSCFLQLLTIRTNSEAEMVLEVLESAETLSS